MGGLKIMCANETHKRDVNRQTTSSGITDDSSQDISQLRVDSTSKRLLVETQTDDVDTPTIYNVEISNANSTISQALPSGTRKFKFYATNWAMSALHSGIIKYAYATNSSSVVVIPPGNYDVEDGVSLTGKTLYMTSSTGSAKAVIKAWT